MPATTRLEAARVSLESAPAARVARVEALLVQTADPLARRLRGAALRSLAERMAATVPGSLDRTPSDVDACALLVTTVPRSLALFAAELAEATEALDALRALLGTLADAPSRRQAFVEHLQRTVSDPAQRRGDLEALERHFDLDTLLERLARQRDRQGVLEELAFQFLAASADRLRDAPDLVRATARITPGALSRDLRETLAAGLRSVRWQTATSAIRAAVALTRAAAVPLHPAAPDDLFHHVVARAIDPEEHVAVVLEVLSAAAAFPESDRASLLGQLCRAGLDRHPSDRALVRARALELLSHTAGDGTPGWWSAAHAAEEPSEHVRMRLFEAAARRGAFDAFATLVRSAAGYFEASPRVRAVALRALLGHRGASSAPDALLRAVFETEQDALVLEVGCAAMLDAVRTAPDAPGLVDLVRELLGALRARTDVTPSVHEAVSAATEGLDTLLDGARALVTQALREALASTPSGGTLRLELGALPAAARSLAADPSRLARVLAELARDGLGLDARPFPGGYRIVRGDRFRLKLWRVLHELRARAPNKRQAFRHTVGRSLSGTLRAHPAGMDEVTATTVPGERVSVDGQGGWGRHLPTVDDLLHLPLLQHTPIQLASSHGVTTLHPPRSAARRLANRLHLGWSYARWAALRLASLRSEEPSERRAYVTAIRARLDVGVEFSPHEPGPVPRHVGTTLGPARLLGIGAALGPALDVFSDRLPYLLSPSGNSQPALALFAGGMLAATMMRSYVARRRIHQARARIPLSIGGWGTRGKSGTERIKAALFHGLGHQVLVKTTGCEAMFIHSVPGQRPLEVFLYRPYDKASIWEQARVVDLAARLGSEVFLWECMALNPRYVDVLAHEWMRDELTTLTNAFPDHEDIQGPAGQNVAEVIARFIPRGGTCFTSELNFLPLFQEEAAARGTQLLSIGPHDGDLLPEDLLALIPYQEHPRNVALVLRLAEHLGIEPSLALVLMAEHVVPDLGVLKTYPDVRLWGRTLRFINGMSANERTGCVSNWRRMGLGELDVDAQPERQVVTVVNNRDDRVARSEVFGRILVEDLAADRHVLIGTNLGGLVGYAEEALARWLPTLEVVPRTDEEGGTPAPERLARAMARLRVPAPRMESVLVRLDIYARGARLRVANSRPVAAALAPWLGASPTGSTELREVRAALAEDRALGEALAACLLPDEAPDEGPCPELDEPASRDEVVQHLLDVAARVIVHARLRAALPASASPAAAAAFHARLRAAYAAIFRASLVVVSDPRSTGDQTIARAVRAVPPGTDLTLMGIQNIKGTGLDFAYRWVALGRVASALDDLGREHGGRRARALEELHAAGDHGLLDTGLAVARLGDLEAAQRTQQDRDRVRALRTRYEQLFAARKAALASGSGPESWLTRAGRALRRGFDHLDSVRRTRESRQVLEDLVTQRISIARAATELRALTVRQKGG